MIQDYTFLILLYIGMWSIESLIPGTPIECTQMMEICDNGIDDDGDGLIDCFDEDCFGTMACDGFYYGSAGSTCTFEPEVSPDFALEFVCQTDKTLYPIDQRSAVYVGDMDGDGIPEMLANDPSPGRIQIFNGQDCSIKQSIVVGTNSPFAQVAIADVDLNGLGDIFLWENGNRLSRYEYGNPNAVWTTADNIEVNNFTTPHIADFNADGVPEVYGGNKIFNTIDGTRLAAGVGSRGNYNNNSDSKTIAYDVFQPGDPNPIGGVFGAEAMGLELIAGNNVYTVDLGDGTMDNGVLTVVSQITTNGLTDGFTSIADVDGDGAIDIIVMDPGRIYVWNPRTQTQIGTSYFIANTSGGGRINIGDFDNDGMVELGTAGNSIYVVLEYDAANNTLVEKWTKTGLDDGSQRTGSSLFDFEGDGKKEVVYSEEAFLFILNAKTGAEIVRIPAEAGTRSEYPLVADVNADGAAEVILTAQDGNGPGFSGNDYVQVYRSSSNPWVSARPVWNQHGYFNTNINDDLSVPVVQQDILNPALGTAFNSFLSQTTILSSGSTPAFAAADATIEIMEVSTEDCPDTLGISMKVENLGSAQLPAGTPIAFYTSNPSTSMATLIGTTTLSNTIDPDSMDLIMYDLNIDPLLTPVDIFVVVNDTGFVTGLPYIFDMDFPVTGTAECDFTNNLDSFLNIICLEICGDNKDNDGDNLADEPNIIASDTTGCSGTILAQMTTDLLGGTWGLISDIGTTVDGNGNVTLGVNDSPIPNVDTLFYLFPPCNDTILITTVDDLPPSLACPGNRDVFVDTNCETTLQNYLMSSTTSDNCTASNAITLSQMPTSGTSLSLGTTTVTITATDISGNATNCNFLVIVKDNIDPTITCPANANVIADNDCNFSIPDYTSAASGSDNCTANVDIIITQFPLVGTIISGENFTQIIIVNSEDESGNMEQCFFQITIIDTIAPILICPANQVLVVATDCSATIPNYITATTITDNCTSTSDLSIAQVPIAGTIITGHNTMENITVTATDNSGNTNQCSFQVSLDDQSPPSLTCPLNKNVEVDNSCTISVLDYTNEIISNDNCAIISSISLSQTPIAGTILNGAGNIELINIVGNDGNGNSSTCSFTIQLTDTISPVITCPITDTLSLNALCQAVVLDYTEELILSDNCVAEMDLMVSQSPVPGITLSGHGTTQVVTITVADGNGNSRECDFLIVLKDTILPSITCPINQLLSVDAMCEIMLMDYTSAASIDDNCTPEVFITVSQIPIPNTTVMGDGTIQTVTLIANDRNGNTKECSFDIALNDDVDPSITCPGDQTIPVDINCEIVLPDYTSMAIVTSQCFPATDFMLSQTPIAGTLISGVGTMQEITLTADNGAGKTNFCKFNISLTDTLAPTLICPTDITLSPNNNCEIILPNYNSTTTTMDNCSMVSSITLSQNPTAGSILTGTMNHTILVTAEDEAGNINQCSFNVFTQDDSAPIISCPTDVTLSVDSDCQIALQDYTTATTVSDICTPISNISITQTPIAGTTLFDAGTMETITLTANDGSGRSSCEFRISLVDTIAPTILCPGNQTIPLEDNCIALVPDYRNTTVHMDNCTLENTLVLSQSPAPNTLLTGPNTFHTVVLSINDESGNSSDCSFEILLKDEIAPDLNCPDNEMILVKGCAYELPDYTGQAMIADNCSSYAAINILQIPPAGIILENSGIQEITLTITDENSNSIQCSFFLELEIMVPEAPSVFGN